MLDTMHVPIHDAERLEHSWGVKVAIEMLHDGLVTPMDFLSLCEEAADAESGGSPRAPACSR